MKIEVGKCYKTRDGRKVGPMSLVPARMEKFCYVDETNKAWAEDGSFSLNGREDDLDIISEWHEEGLKHDAGKPIAGIMFEDFPNALSGVCDVATFGANKYKRSSWKTVSGAHQRYSDALARHLLAKGKGEVNDPESGLPHSYHIAWNSLAIAELEVLNAR